MKGAEAPICRPDPVSREVCCLPGSRIRDVAERLPGLVSPTDYYPLIVVHVGASDMASSSLKNIKKDYRALGEVVRGSGAQVVFSSILQDKGEDLKNARRIWQMNKWLEQRCHSQRFGYLDHGTQFGRPGVLEAGGAGLTTKGKSCFGRRLARLVKAALNYICWGRGALIQVCSNAKLLQLLLPMSWFHLELGSDAFIQTPVVWGTNKMD